MAPEIAVLLELLLPAKLARVVFALLFWQMRVVVTLGVSLRESEKERWMRG